MFRFITNVLLMMCVILCGTVLFFSIFIMDKPEIKPEVKPEVKPMTIEEVARAYVKGLHLINKDNNRYCSASNIVYKGKPYILTNMHCCQAANILHGGNQVIANGRVLPIIKISGKADLCLVKSYIEGGLPVAEIDTQPLDKITLVGHPRGIDLVIREGRVVTKDLNVCVFYFPEGPLCRDSDRISALAYPGNSGSPVLNERMELVSVLYAGDDQFPHEPVVVPLKLIKEFLDSI